MTDPAPKSQSATVQALNATPLSRHVEALLRVEQAPVEPNSLVLLSLLEWAQANHYRSPTVGQMELGATARAAQDDPEAVYENLADPRMLQARTLEQASAVLVSRLSDLLDDRSISSPSPA